MKNCHVYKCLSSTEIARPLNSVWAGSQSVQVGSFEVSGIKLCPGLCKPSSVTPSQSTLEQKPEKECDPHRGSCHPDLITEKAKWRDPPPSRWKEVLRTVRNYRFELFLTHLCLWTITPAPTKCQSLLLREQPVNKDKTKLWLLPRSPHYTLLLNSCHSNNSPRKEIKSYLCNFPAAFKRNQK